MSNFAASCSWRGSCFKHVANVAGLFQGFMVRQGHRVQGIVSSLKNRKLINIKGVIKVGMAIDIKIISWF